jgi:hypothetical protein
MERMKADKIRSHSRLIAKLGKAQFYNDLRHDRLAYCLSVSPKNVFVLPDAQSVTPQAVFCFPDAAFDLPNPPFCKQNPPSGTPRAQSVTPRAAFDIPKAASGVSNMKGGHTARCQSLPVLPPK